MVCNSVGSCSNGVVDMVAHISNQGEEQMKKIDEVDVVAYRAGCIDRLFQLGVLSAQERNEQYGWLRTDMGLPQELPVQEPLDNRRLRAEAKVCSSNQGEE